MIISFQLCQKYSILSVLKPSQFSNLDSLFAVSLQMWEIHSNTLLSILGFELCNFACGHLLKVTFQEISKHIHTTTPQKKPHTNNNKTHKHHSTQKITPETQTKSVNNTLPFSILLLLQILATNLQAHRLVCLLFAFPSLSNKKKIIKKNPPSNYSKY